MRNGIIAHHLQPAIGDSLLDQGSDQRLLITVDSRSGQNRRDTRRCEIKGQFTSRGKIFADVQKIDGAIARRLEILSGSKKRVRIIKPVGNLVGDSIPSHPSGTEVIILQGLPIQFFSRRSISLSVAENTHFLFLQKMPNCRGA